MQIREYQTWLQGWDRERGWDRRVMPAHTLIHAMEEFGEVARLVLQWEGYKEAESTQRLHAELTEELSDLFVFLFKLAYQTGVDVEAALTAGQAKADQRYPDLAAANAELARYHNRQSAELAQLTANPGSGRTLGVVKTMSTRHHPSKTSSCGCIHTGPSTAACSGNRTAKKWARARATRPRCCACWVLSHGTSRTWSPATARTMAVMPKIPTACRCTHSYQVILKPDPGNPQELYLGSLDGASALTATSTTSVLSKTTGNRPRSGAWGLGWEVWLDGLEITQFTYFQQAGGFPLDPVSVELTYGLERIVMYLQGVEEVWQIDWDGRHTYGDLLRQPRSSTAPTTSKSPMWDG